MSFSPFDLDGKVAIVTGGGSGIGLGIARALAGAGASLLLCAKRRDRCEKACAELAALGVDAIAQRCDVSDAKEVGQMVDAAKAHFGHIDILVNNAGISGSARPALEITLEEWQRTIAVNLTGTFLCSQAVGRQMKHQGGGKIINIASVGAFKPLPLSSDYSASKGGVLMLTRVLAIELIRHNIHVNAICPGYVATELQPDSIKSVATRAARKIPAGRIGTTGDMGGAAVFLASAASDYLVGASIVADGGVMLT